MSILFYYKLDGRYFASWNGKRLYQKFLALYKKETSNRCDDRFIAWTISGRFTNTDMFKDSWDSG